MKISKFLVILIVLSIFVLPGCVDDSKTTSQQNSIINDIALAKAEASQARAEVKALQDTVAKKADQSVVDTILKMVGSGSGQAANTYTKDQLYTKAEVDKIIGDLKNDQSWIKSSYNNSANSKGSVISSNGDLELIVERSPGEDEVWINDNIPVEWRLTVRNKSGTGTYFRITSNFDTVEGSVLIASAKLTPSYSQSSIICTPNPYSSTTAVNNMSFTTQSSASESRVWIPKNSEQSLYMVLQIDYTEATVTGRRWAWDFSIRQLN